MRVFVIAHIRFTSNKLYRFINHMVIGHSLIYHQHKLSDLYEFILPTYIILSVAPIFIIHTNSLVSTTHAKM